MRILLLSVAILFQVSLSAQDLAGTSWTAINPEMRDTFSIEFGHNDTIYLEDSIHHDIATATYEVVAGQLNFIDLEGTSECHVTPATYRIEMSADSLKFVLVNDLCKARADILTSYKWVHAKYGLHKQVPKGSVSLYPSREQMTLFLNLPGWIDRSEFKIFKLSQQLMLAGEITRENPQIDLSTVPPGNYILFLAANQQTYRLVIDATRR